MRRPTVKRYQLKKTYAGRTVKRTVVERRHVNNLRRGRTLRQGRSLRPHRGR